ncbi:MAG TPA: hypothetical protein VLQ92_05390 [Candidatus Limnocylindrales bacterium]|nr:hypothetical protein [Candidatus Limnocylindrales bacterium]
MTLLDTRVSPDRSLEGLTRCTDADLGTAHWWACLARNLDALAEDLATADTDGLAAQIIADAPEYAASAKLLTTLDTQLRCDVLELRHQVADLSGSPTSAFEVRDEVIRLIRRVRTLDRQSRELLVEAYGRDLGGE